MFLLSLRVSECQEDTAQAYRNEEEAGKAIRESGLAREDIYITTKYSGTDGLDIETSIQNSLANVRAAHGCGSNPTLTFDGNT